LCKREREIERQNVEEKEEEGLVEIENPNQCDINKHEVNEHIRTVTKSYLISSPIGTPMFLFFSDKASVVHYLDPQRSNFPYEIDVFGTMYTMHAKSYSTTRDGTHFYSKMKINIGGQEVLCKIDNLYDSEIERLLNIPDFFDSLFNSFDDYDCLICYKKK
jgi:hypothetical protein